MFKDIAYERRRTRDRLLDYDLPPIAADPYTSSLPVIYPWSQISTSILQHQIYLIAKNKGFTLDEDAFWTRFLGGSVIGGTVDTFPVPGDEGCLYLDQETGELYYFKIATTPINMDAANLVGAIVKEAETPVIGVIYLYIPVRALLMENTILNCGTAEDYIIQG